MIYIVSVIIKVVRANTLETRYGGGEDELTSFANIQVALRKKTKPNGK